MVVFECGSKVWVYSSRVSAASSRQAGSWSLYTCFLSVPPLGACRDATSRDFGCLFAMAVPLVVWLRRGFCCGWGAAQLRSLHQISPYPSCNSEIAELCQPSHVYSHLLERVRLSHTECAVSLQPIKVCRHMLSAADVEVGLSLGGPRAVELAFLGRVSNITTQRESSLSTTIIRRSSLMVLDCLVSKLRSQVPT